MCASTSDAANNQAARTASPPALAVLGSSGAPTTEPVRAAQCTSAPSPGTAAAQEAVRQCQGPPAPAAGANVATAPLGPVSALDKALARDSNADVLLLPTPTNINPIHLPADDLLSFIAVQQWVQASLDIPQLPLLNGVLVLVHSSALQQAAPAQVQQAAATGTAGSASSSTLAAAAAAAVPWRLRQVLAVEAAPGVDPADATVVLVGGQRLRAGAVKEGLLAEVSDYQYLCCELAALQLSRQLCPLQVFDVAHMVWRLQVACEVADMKQSCEQDQVQCSAAAGAPPHSSTTAGSAAVQAAKSTLKQLPPPGWVSDQILPYVKLNPYAGPQPAGQPQQPLSAAQHAQLLQSAAAAWAHFLQQKLAGQQPQPVTEFVPFWRAVDDSPLEQDGCGLQPPSAPDLIPPCAVAPQPSAAEVDPAPAADEQQQPACGAAGCSAGAAPAAPAAAAPAGIGATAQDAAPAAAAGSQAPAAGALGHTPSDQAAAAGAAAADGSAGSGQLTSVAIAAAAATHVEPEQQQQQQQQQQEQQQQQRVRPSRWDPISACSEYEAYPGPPPSVQKVQKHSPGKAGVHRSSSPSKPSSTLRRGRSRDTAAAAAAAAVRHRSSSPVRRNSSSPARRDSSRRGRSRDTAPAAARGRGRSSSPRRSCRQEDDDVQAYLHQLAKLLDRQPRTDGGASDPPSVDLTTLRLQLPLPPGLQDRYGSIGGLVSARTELGWLRGNGCRGGNERVFIWPQYRAQLLAGTQERSQHPRRSSSSRSRSRSRSRRRSRSRSRDQAWPCRRWALWTNTAPRGGGGNSSSGSGSGSAQVKAAVQRYLEQLALLLEQRGSSSPLSMGELGRLLPTPFLVREHYGSISQFLRSTPELQLTYIKGDKLVELAPGRAEELRAAARSRGG